jgi:hypothetical protein
MLSNVLLYVGSFVVIVWGIAHIIPTKAVVAGYGTLSDDNRRIITMEWVAEGLAMIFIGVLVALAALTSGASNPTAILVYRSAVVMLIVMAAWTFMTGARTSITPIKICPIVKIAVATLILIGSSL